MTQRQRSKPLSSAPASSKRAKPRRATSPRSQPPSSFLRYPCSGCGLVYLSDRHLWDHDKEMSKPVAKTHKLRAGNKPWWECPVGGPRFGIFGKEGDPDSARYRLTLDICGETVTVCTPCVPHLRAAHGHKTLSFGQLLSDAEIRREWYLKRARREDSGGEVDLAHERCAGSDVVSPEGRYELLQAGEATIEQLQTSVEMLYQEFFGAHITPLRQLAAALGAMPVPGDPEREEKATIWVPIDLRCELPPQLRDIKPQLDDLQRFLHKAAGRSIPRKGRRTPTVWRDICIFLLKTAAGLQPKRFATDFFPAKDPIGAEAQVRIVCHRVQKVMNTYGISFL